MPSSIYIKASTFAEVFRRFQQLVDLSGHPSGPFHDFQSGKAYSMESYKEWLYSEARHRLDAESWTPDMIGSGQILQHVIDAIQIDEGEARRNNIVEWRDKRGPEAKSTFNLLTARKERQQWRTCEKALWDMYVTAAPAPACFARLAELFGPRYDLISYLFFIRDWSEFMPVRSSIFPPIFKLLGVDHPMIKRCSWENYAGVMERFREVQRHLAGYGIPNGVRLVDAHSFCWMLYQLDKDYGPLPAETPPPRILPLNPQAGPPPARARGAETTQTELEEIQGHQKRIGALAQLLVYKAERRRLQELGRKDLAEKVQDVSHNVSLGYDILSFTVDGKVKPIEVKAAAKRGNDLRFFLSENERLQAKTLPHYRFVLVLDPESREPQLHEFAGADLPDAALSPTEYEARLIWPKA